MLSWAPDTLYLDGRSLSDIKQGVTLEVFGEGESLGPLTAQTRAAALASQGDLKHPIDWTTLGEGLDALVKRGISPNIASFVGAATIREHELGYANRAPTPDELKCMQDLVRVAMREGAVGVGSALIYAPGTYAKTDELVALAQVAGKYHGAYISHMRSEGDRLLESVDELIEIARAAQVHGEVYHFKAAGKANWPKMREAIAKIDAARARGLDISANMYTYTAGATGLDAAMPTWVQEGGIDEWIKRLKNPAIRARVVREMRTPSGDWENLLLAAGSADKVVLVQFDNPVLKPLTGKTLAEVARRRGESPEETAIDLVIQDHSRVGTVYFLMSEDDVELGLKQSWVAIGSDEGSYAPEGVFLKFMPHPRAYGNVARFLGHYVRDEHVTSLTDAIHRLSALPAHNLKLHDRGELKPGDYADIVIFDPIKIADQATYDHPQQFATGVRDVFVNGVQVLKNGEHTGAMPGQVVRGPGWSGWPDAVSRRTPTTSHSRRHEVTRCGCADSRRWRDRVGVRVVFVACRARCDGDRAGHGGLRCLARQLRYDHAESRHAAGDAWRDRAGIALDSQGRCSVAHRATVRLPLLEWLLQFAHRCNWADFKRITTIKSALLHLSRQALEGLIRSEHMDCEFETTGTLNVYRDARTFAHSYWVPQTLSECDMPVEILDGTACRKREPALNESIVGGYFNPQDARLRPDRVPAELARVIRENGGEIHESTRISGFRLDGGRIAGVVTDKGEFSGRDVVLALGSWSPLLARQLDLRIPIQPGKGYSITYTRPQECPRIPLTLKERAVCVTGWGSGYRLGSTMEFAGYDDSLNRKRLDALKRGAAEYLREPEGPQILEEWYGWRPMTYDDLPVLGPVTNLQNLMLATGHGMLGVTMSAATGLLVSEMICGRTPSLDVSAYSPARFNL